MFTQAASLPPDLDLNIPRKSPGIRLIVLAKLALMWLYACGVPNAKETAMTNIDETRQTKEENIDVMEELLDSLDIRKITRRVGVSAGGAWVKGTMGGHRFDALVFPVHADQREYELEGDSRISKLWVQRISDRTTVANFDRGWDVEPTTPIAQQIVALLATGLAETVYADLKSNEHDH